MSRFGNLIFISLNLTISVSVMAASEVAQTFSYQGRLFNAAGTAPSTDQVDFIFSIYAPSGNNCLLYQETQSADLSITDGLFSFQLGSFTGAGKRTASDPGLTMATIFGSRAVAIRAAATANCAAGYTPAAGDVRRVRVSVSRNAGAFSDLSPDQTVNSSATAIVAQTLQGYTPTNFIMSSTNITQANVEVLTDGSDASTLHHHDGRYLTPSAVTAQSLGAAGAYTTGTFAIGLSTSPGSQLVVKGTGASSATSSLNVTNSSNSSLLFVRDDGNVGVGTGTPSAGLHIANNGAASSAGMKGDGTWFTGGNATTTKPYFLVEPSGTTSSSWSTSGTGLGVNAASGFAGNIMDIQAGGVSKLRVSPSNTGTKIVSFGGSVLQPPAISVRNDGGSLSATGSFFEFNTSNGVNTNGTMAYYFNSISSQFSHTSGAGSLIKTDHTFGAPAGNATYKHLDLGYTLNNSGAQSGSTTGIFLNATETALNSMTHNLMDLQVGGASKLRVSNGGEFSVNSLYLGTVGGLSLSRMDSPSDGVLRLRDYGGSTFGRLQFGGTTSSFPAIKRSSAAIAFRLADDSADADITTAGITASGAINTDPTGTGGSSKYIQASYDGGFRLSGSVGFWTNASDSLGNGVNRIQTAWTYPGGLLVTPTGSYTDTSGTTIGLQTAHTFAAAAGSANFRPLNLAYTINNSGAQSGTATGIYLNATETSLNSMGHNLMDLQVGGVSKFKVTANASAAYIDVNGATFSNQTTTPNLNLSNGTYGISFGGSTAAMLRSPASGILLMTTDTSNNSFGRLQFGGTSSSYPALKRNSAAIAFRLADDSADAAISTASITASGNITISSNAGGGLTNAQIDNNGAIIRDASDIRLKKEVRSLENPLHKILKIKGVSYMWTDGRNGMKRDLGFLAQDLEKVIPEVVHVGADKQKLRAVNYGHLVAVVVGGIKEFYQKFIKHEAKTEREIASLKIENAEVKKKLSAIEMKNLEIQKQNFDIQKQNLLLIDRLNKLEQRVAK
ncbi:MAG: tail fiber domain-containing protein [Bacteriovoracaceae bacterium]